MRQLRRVTLACMALLTTIVSAAPLGAQSFLMTMRGFLDGNSSLVSSVATPFASLTPFTLTALFNTTTPNLVAPIGIPGFVAYSPSSMQFTVGGITYAVQPFTAASPTGLSVAIFDKMTPFGVPNRYGVGVIQNPLADGAGIVADYLGATPEYVLGSTGVVSTTFTGFMGVGVSSGVCTLGTPDSCQAHAVTPIPLTFASQQFSLVLGNYDADVSSNFSYSVIISAVPEPSSVLLTGAGLLGIVLVVRRKTRCG